MKENKKKKPQRTVYLDNDTYSKAVTKGEQDDRSFTKHVEFLIKEDLKK